eukprot:756308-Hanusia_phi.AAC.1
MLVLLPPVHYLPSLIFPPSLRSTRFCASTHPSFLQHNYPTPNGHFPSKTPHPLLIPPVPATIPAPTRYKPLLPSTVCGPGPGPGTVRTG